MFATNFVRWEIDDIAHASFLVSPEIKNPSLWHMFYEQAPHMDYLLLKGRAVRY
jgi:hypothetical protein